MEVYWNTDETDDNKYHIIQHMSKKLRGTEVLTTIFPL